MRIRLKKGVAFCSMYAAPETLSVVRPENGVRLIRRIPNEQNKRGTHSCLSSVKKP